MVLQPQTWMGEGNPRTLRDRGGRVLASLRSPLPHLISPGPPYAELYQPLRDSPAVENIGHLTPHLSTDGKTKARQARGSGIVCAAAGEMEIRLQKPSSSST